MGGTGGGSSETGGPRPGNGPDCPLKFQTKLVDVPQTGNAAHAFALKPGTDLDVVNAPDDKQVVVQHNGKAIGYLPPKYAVVQQCIAAGWRYSASVVKIGGDKKSPKIEVLVIGVAP